ncbi:hypothetical protein HRI_003040900 [Hibiscus trionum]|uniref:Integrase catalytic domain-containing protein n=1 Tax=Hibiscus trionum TaxID=183268 RepID=A0A9W7IEP1_HIBTR|nr:hypothetical protein HRI_003040900 [Hibiscus trionum]
MKEKLVIGHVPEQRRNIIQFFHGSAVGGHSGAKAIIHRIISTFYWKGLRREVKNAVRECMVCQRNKGELSLPGGLLQPLVVPIPSTIWSSISMDFIEGLPQSKKRDCIFVVVDRLTKYAHFVALAHSFTAKSIAQVFLENIFKLYGLPVDIVCDRDRIFMSTFWKELMSKLGVTINASIA